MTLTLDMFCACPCVLCAPARPSMPQSSCCLQGSSSEGQLALPGSSRQSCLQGEFCAESASWAAAAVQQRPGQVFWVAQEDEPSASPCHTCPEVRTNLGATGSLSQRVSVTAKAEEAELEGSESSGPPLTHSLLGVQPEKTMISYYYRSTFLSLLMSVQKTLLIWASLCPLGCWSEGKPC